MKIEFIGLDRLYDDFSWRITRRAKAVWKSGNMVIGRHVPTSEVAQLETSIAKYTKREYAVAVGSGTDALYFALKTKGIGPGKTVLCPAISFMATAEAVKRTGANIEFIDGVTSNFSFEQFGEVYMYRSQTTFNVHRIIIETSGRSFTG